MVPLDRPSSGHSFTGFDELHLPAGKPEAGPVLPVSPGGVARRRANAPACFGGGGNAEIGPRAEEEGGRAMPGGAHGEAPAGGEIIGAVVLGQDADGAGYGRVVESLLDRPEHIERFAGAELDQPIGIDPEGGKAYRIKPPLCTG